MSAVLHLCDLMDEAEIDAPSPAHVGVQPVDVGGSEAIAIFQHPDSIALLPLPEGVAPGVLRFACGIKTTAWQGIRSPVTFRLGLETPAGRRWLFEQSVDPRRVEADRAWLPAEVEIPGDAHALVLQTSAGRRGTAYAWAAWADPTLEARGGYVPARSRWPRTKPGHVLLITADACRADDLSWHGGRTPTPNLDALAADGVIFTAARTNSTTTVGSCSSLLTGRQPWVHRALEEWSPFPAHLPSLPVELARRGYHTVFAPGEVEIGARAAGFSAVFAQTIACVSRPTQDAAMTVRRLQHALGHAPDAPWFVWVDFFDAHPPHRLPDELVRPFYEGDPRQPERRWKPELVPELHGVESLVEFVDALPVLRAGHVDAHAYARLRDTVRSLADPDVLGPDLVSHVTHLGERATGGRTPSEFSAWLRACVHQLDRNVVPPDLVPWIEKLVVELEELERETLGAAVGVVDFDYLRAQRAAAVAHIDRQIGELVADIRESGVYDDTTIVFLGPHGESIGEGGVYFDHLSPHECVLRTPMLLKPPAGHDRLRGSTIDDVVESVDLLPTLLALLDLPAPASDGVDVLREPVVTARDRITFSVDAGAVRVCASLPPYKLVMSRGWSTLNGSIIPPLEPLLYRTDSDEVQVPAAEAKDVHARLEAAVHEWLATVDFPPLPG